MTTIHQQMKGFTLVEMVLYVTLASVLLLTTSTFLGALLSVSIKDKTKSEVNQQGTEVVMMISQSIRNAKSVTTPSVGATSTSLTITTSVASTSPTVFDIATGTIRIKEGSSTAIALTNSRVSASNLLFSNTSASSTDGGSVEFSFMLTYVSSSTRSEYQASSTFSGFAPFH